jgi:osmotically inducible protein OsmC
MPTRTAIARYQGLGKKGKGSITTQSGILNDTAYGFGSRFGEEHGTNPEELIAAAHAGCFTMSLSFALERAGYTEGKLETQAAVVLDKQGNGFAVTRSDLDLTAHIPGIKPAEFTELVETAKKTCPISKLLNADIALRHRLK